MQRYFIDQSKTAGKVILPEEVAHHLVTVLRAAVGTKFELVTADFDNSRQCHSQIDREPW